MPKKELRMTFDPQTIEHLGVKMYANLPNAIAELIANAYDADASNVHIRLYDNKEGKNIQIIDDGTGMSLDEINTEFLRIGRNRRADGKITSPSGERKATGKKGLGKLALFGIGDTIEIKTTKKDSDELIIFILDWNELIATKDSDYKPKYTTTKCEKDECGTTITLSNLKRKSPFDVSSMAISTAKLFNFPDKLFKIYISLNDGDNLQITHDLRYEGIKDEQSWKFPDFLSEVSPEYIHKDKINGHVVATPRPLKPGLRGITLYSNGRLVNAPEFFGVSESSHGYSYFTGWLDVDFVDEWEEDVIATDRQTLNWDLPPTEELRNYLRDIMFKLEQVRRVKRKEIKRKSFEEQTNIEIVNWLGKLPDQVLKNVEPIIETIIENSELSDEDQNKTLTKLHQIAPEYPYFHWRNLHSEVKEVSEPGYQSTDYYRAFEEAIKRYITKARAKSGDNSTEELTLLSKMFGSDANKQFTVTKKYVTPGSAVFSDKTIQNIEDGQQTLSRGIWTGGRNPVHHTEIGALRDSGLFSEKDCLDLLSLLSHLFKRLDDAETK